MSGHSKWANIKHKKEAQDKKRGKIFSKLSRIITLAVQQSGGVFDPEKNVKLRLAVNRAKSENMPKININRAIEKAMGGGEEALREVVYEGFGPEGVSFVISVTTDNPNRSYAGVKQVLDRGGGKIGSTNSVLYQFDKCGVVEFDKRKTAEDEIFAFSDRIGALDIDDAGDSFVVYIPFDRIGSVEKNLNGLTYRAVDIFYKPKNTISIRRETASKIEKLCDALEDLDDVDKVYSNYES